MKKHYLYMLMLFFMLSVSHSCQEAGEELISPDIYGSWTVMQSDDEGQTYWVELRFNDDNTFDWMLLDPVPGHSDSHAAFILQGNRMIITEDADCDGTGRYLLHLEGNKLAIIGEVDACAPRATGLEFVWTRK